MFNNNSLIDKNQSTVETTNPLFPPCNPSSQYDIIQDSFQAFLFDRQAQGLSVGTLEFYQKKLGLFFKFIEQMGINRITEISPQMIRAFFISLEQKGHRPGGIHACFRALKTFLIFFENENVIPDWSNPIRRIRAPRVPLEILEPIPSDHILALLKSCDSSKFLGIRDRAIILTLLDSGTRCGECLSILREDVNLNNGEIIIRRGKGAKGRKVIISNNTREAIKKYLDYRKDCNLYLWVNKANQRLTYGGLRSIMRRMAKRVNIPTPALHGFRRTFALQMVRQGVNIFTLQKLMGHSSLEVLNRYLAQNDEDLINAHELGSPVTQLLIQNSIENVDGRKNE